MMKKIFLLIICTLLLGVVTDVNAFSISPLKQIVTLEQGTGRNVKIKVRNTERLTTKYKITVIGVKQDDQGYPVYGVGIEEAENWVKAEQEVIEIKSGKEVEVSFKIAVPKGTFPGSHYIGLSAEPILNEEGNNNFSGKLISLLLLEVSGEVNETLSVVSWSGEKSLYWNLDKVKINVVLKNSGNTELPLSGKIRLYNWLDKKVIDNDVYLGSALLPQTQRKNEVLLPSQNGIYLPGVYRAQLDLTYGRTGQKLSVQYSFWYIPLGWIIAGGAMLVFIIFVLIKKIINKKRQLSLRGM
ncbi:MAG: hypothetical protein Q7J14_01220 [Candidatus Magasanikbacteria bacterium]|nr:hypothetical protein [Candidatus Magasanikbacteria bacterium]